LNVDLAVAKQVSAAAFGGKQVIGIAAERSYGLRHRDAIAIRPVQRFWIERTCDNVAAKIGAVAQPFFVGEPQHLYGEGQPLLVCVQALYACKGEQDTERAVVFAGIS